MVKTSIIITSFKEPHTIGRAIESFLQQKISSKHELVVAAPDKETLDVAKKYQKKNKQVKLFQDPGKGKNYAINLLLKKVKGEIIILTDGDVYVSDNSVNEILKLFKEKDVGAVSGHPVSLENKKTLLGYWSHMLCYAAHKLRKKTQNQNKFLECTGYYWAFKNKIIKKFPLDIAEDSVVPALLWCRGFKIKYAEKALVYVSYPKNFKDYIEQKKRTIKSHEKLNIFMKNNIPKMKSFKSEASGFFTTISYASNFRELFYSFLAIPVRFYLWVLAYMQFLFKKEYQDAWKRVESTKI